MGFKRCLSITGLAALIAFSASAKSFTFNTSSLNLGRIIQTKNCFDHQYCRSYTSRLYIDENNQYKVSIKINTSQADLYGMLSECKLQSYQSSLPNIFVKKFDIEALKHIHDQITSFLKANERQAAIDYVIAQFGFQKNDYMIYSSATVSEQHSVTDHITKKIEIGNVFFKNSCLLALAIRHELEHAQQYMHAKKCFKETGIQHNLSQHLPREQAAYLNDHANIDLMCPYAKTRENLKQNAVDQIIDRYLN